MRWRRRIAPRRSQRPEQRARRMSGPGPLILAVDQGTSGSTCLVMTSAGEVVSRAHREVAVRYPRYGWVEQDP